MTGGLGYLGTLLIRELPDHPEFSQDTIRILITFYNLVTTPSGTHPATPSTNLWKATSATQTPVALEGVDTVFHLAAITNAPETFDIQEKTWEVNHEAAVGLFVEAREADVDGFVNAVTCSVYGRTEE